ncbi:MAG: hypothetical protein M3313_11305 [Actinomycetota bacterium]|nr:hypothetical protein [Actinomycetota bacterium]
MPPAVLDVSVGVAFCVLGVLLLSRRPLRVAGILMVTTGSAWLLGSLFPAAVFLHRGPLIHLLVGYPRGRPRGRLARLVVAIGYLDSVQPLGRNHFATMAVALVVAAVTVAGYQSASGADRRARLTSSVVGVVLMAVLGVGAGARLAGLDVDPELVVVYQTALLASAAVLFADARWGRWDRATITSLVVDLGRSEDARSVRDKLARALSDPALELGFPGPGTGSLVDETGRLVRLTPAESGREWTKLRHDGQEIGVVNHARGALDDPALLDSVTALTRMAFENVQLQAAVRGRVSDVEASRRRILEVSDRERQALEAELRSGAVHRLERVKRLLDPTDAELFALLQSSRASLRDFARGVHPRSLAAGGLAAACAELAATMPLPVSVDVPDIRLAAEVELSLYFVCAEALTNVAKYAGASQVKVALAESAGRVRLTVTDDGCGGASLDQAGQTEGTGLRGLADRLAVIGGSLAVESPKGHGTSVIAEVPRWPE